MFSISANSLADIHPFHLPTTRWSYYMPYHMQYPCSRHDGLVLFLTSLTGCYIGSKCRVADDVNRRPIRENSTCRCPTIMTTKFKSQWLEIIECTCYSTKTNTNNATHIHTCEAGARRKAPLLRDLIPALPVFESKQTGYTGTHLFDIALLVKYSRTKIRITALLEIGLQCEAKF